MLTVVLTILKWIGIALLVLLGVLIFLLCLILFVPIRYKANGFCKDSYQIHAKATWLLHIISFTVDFKQEQPFRMKLRILGISIYDNLKEKKTKKTKVNTLPEIVGASKQERSNAESVEEITKAEKPIMQEQNTNIIKDISVSEANVDGDMDAEQEAQRLTFMQKQKKICLKVINFFRNIKYTIRKICDTIKEFKDNITYYVELFKKDSTKVALEACKKQLLRIIKNLKPQKFQVNLHVGMDDPATLGDILGVWGMLYPIHQGHIDICPDFEQTVLEGDFYCKGRITVYIYIWTIMIILFDKDIRRLRKCLVRKGN
ncbi:MAG: hypothetical protein UHN47_04480 [Lachnospiraceae bacterium]|nr:hypothetical protein [Lachnospiraceae bacterium]